VLEGLTQHPEEGEEDRHLEHKGQAPAIGLTLFSL